MATAPFLYVSFDARPDRTHTLKDAPQDEEGVDSV
jgi:hypothetical protein